jgi:hypothetical protein
MGLLGGVVVVGVEACGGASGGVGGTVADAAASDGSGASVEASPGADSGDADVSVDANYDAFEAAGEASAPEEGGTEAGSPSLPAGPSAALLLWLRADKGVTSTGGAISAWADQSAAGNDATQTIAAGQPSLSTGEGPLPVVTFNGVGNYLSLPAGFSDFTAGISAFYVARLYHQTSNHASRLFDFGLALDYSGSYGALTDAVVFAQWQPSGAQLVHESNVTATWGPLITADAVVPGTLTLYELIVAPGSDPTMGAVTMYANGTAKGTGTEAMPDIVTRHSNLIGRSNCSTCGDTYLAGDIGEVVLYNKALGETDRMTVETYLTSRWGL